MIQQQSMCNPLRNVTGNLEITTELIQECRALVFQKEVLEKAMPTVRKFLQSEEPAELINQALNLVMKNPDSDHPFFNQEHFTLHQEFGGPMIMLGFTKQDDNSPIYSVTTNAIIGAVSSDFNYRIFTPPDSWDSEIFSR